MTTKIIVPQLGESVVEATVGTWHKQVGDAVAVGDVLVELQTDKVDVEVGAETAGLLVSIERPTGEDVVIGDVLAVIDPAGVPDAVPAPQPAVPQPTAPEKAAPAATPVARRMAGQVGLDVRQVPGSGPAGRVTKQDVQTYLAQQPPEASPAAIPAPAGPLRSRRPPLLTRAANCASACPAAAAPSPAAWWKRSKRRPC